MAGLYFDEFEPGQRFEHAVRRTVTEADNVLFSTLTMNPAAIHLDAEYSKGTPFGERLVNLAAIAQNLPSMHVRGSRQEAVPLVRRSIA